MNEAKAEGTITEEEKDRLFKEATEKRKEEDETYDKGLGEEDVKRVLPNENEQQDPENQEQGEKGEEEKEAAEQEIVEEELPPLPSRETLEEAKTKNDGSLGQALLTCLGAEDRMTDPQFKVFEDAYDRAMNKAECPCGSRQHASTDRADIQTADKPAMFADCCKQPWRMMRRSYEKEAKREHKAKKQTKKLIEQMSQVKPIITIGVKPDGTIDYNKPKGAPDKVSLADLVDVLQKAWAQAYMHLTIRATKEIIMREFGEDKPSGPLPGL